MRAPSGILFGFRRRSCEPPLPYCPRAGTAIMARRPAPLLGAESAPWSLASHVNRSHLNTDPVRDPCEEYPMALVNSDRCRALPGSMVAFEDVVARLSKAAA